MFMSEAVLLSRVCLQASTQPRAAQTPGCDSDQQALQPQTRLLQQETGLFPDKKTWSRLHWLVSIGQGLPRSQERTSYARCELQRPQHPLSTLRLHGCRTFVSSTLRSHWSLTHVHLFESSLQNPTEEYAAGLSSCLSLCRVLECLLRDNVCQPPCEAI